jgi:hypothetical protein
MTSFQFCDTVTPSLTFSSSKAIILAGTIIAYLSLAISFTGNDLHGLSGLNFRLALAAMFLCVQVAFLSMANTVLFALLASGVGISKEDPESPVLPRDFPFILYDPPGSSKLVLGS